MYTIGKVILSITIKGPTMSMNVCTVRPYRWNGHTITFVKVKTTSIVDVSISRATKNELENLVCCGFKDCKYKSAPNPFLR